ncbi:MAG: inositol monophosphatase family protein, partial [Patescibacteria group bacterium]
MHTALEGMQLAASRGGEQLRKHFGQELAIQEKSMAADVVTKADKDSEAAILEVLAAQFPDYSILSEE